MPRVITVIVSPKGEATIKTRGYSGAECLAASKSFEQALGVVARERKTADFYESATTEQYEQNCE